MIDNKTRNALLREYFDFYGVPVNDFMVRTASVDEKAAFFMERLAEARKEVQELRELRQIEHEHATRKSHEHRP